MLQTVGLVAGFDDVAMVGQPIQRGGGHLGITKYARPFGEAQVGGVSVPVVLYTPGLLQ